MRGSLPSDESWVRVQFDCGHRNTVKRDEYGDGSAWCLACGEFQVYERCLTCHSLDCQSIEGPTLRHGTVTYGPPDRYEINPNVSATQPAHLQQVRVVQGDDQIRTGVTDHWSDPPGSIRGAS